MVNSNIQEIDGRMYVINDWYPRSLPANIKLEENAYPESAFSFSSFHSEQAEGFVLGYASGNYAFGNFIVGKEGRVTIGKFVILNAVNIICNDTISIGDHCMFGWGSVVTDSWISSVISPKTKRKMLERLAADDKRYLEYIDPKPVTVEDNVWVGFDAVVLPGVTLGRGAIIGCKTVVAADVPPYAVVAGNPARIIRYMEPTDTMEARQQVFSTFLKIQLPI